MPQPSQLNDARRPADTFLSQEDLLAHSRRWATRLLDGPINLFPVRHHSPACARYVAQLIQLRRPDTIIIEGPPSMQAMLSDLQSDECLPPVAVLRTYRPNNDIHSPRHSAFYPLCVYSPEWVALRMAKQFGARVRFADLEFEAKVRHQTKQQADLDGNDPSYQGVLLSHDDDLRHSEFTEDLARRLGCRDFDEAWDHLFESQICQTLDESIDREFVGRLATYCDLTRRLRDDSSMRIDATIDREAVMIRCLTAEYRRLKKPERSGAILVVTGGFHTIAIADALDDVLAGKMVKPGHAESQSAPDDSQVASYLLRYSYDQLDALSGYQAGMPSPGFYDAVWSAQECQGGSADASQAAIDIRHAVTAIINRIARQTRGKAISHEASVTDSIAAVQMLDQLTHLRGHAIPTRSDVIDAIGMCMRKEATAGPQANDMLQALVHRELAGDRVGQVPSSVPRPPIMDDYAFQCDRLNLPHGVIEAKSVALDLYRSAKHRQISFFLHRLTSVGVPYATLNDGPDFANGYKLDHLFEHWTCQWSPATEGRLAELAANGESVSAVAERFVVESIERMRTDGETQNAAEAIDWLVRSCRMGLQQYSRRFLSLCAQAIAEDGVFASLSRALSSLSLLRSAREPLEAESLEGMDELTRLCYRRCCHLMSSLAHVPDEWLDASLDGLLSMREWLAWSNEAGDQVSVDESLFFDALAELLAASTARDEPPLRSEIAGAAAGVLQATSRLDEEQLCQVVAGYLNAATSDTADACGVIRGVMVAAREAFWQSTGLLTRIDRLLAEWNDERFQQALPQMRLAFSQMTPREVDHVAGQVASLHDRDELGDLYHADICEADLQWGLRINAAMKASLANDGLIP